MALTFPFEVFPDDIAASLQELAEEYSLPADYMGSTALFTIAALSGAMYQTELNGSIKNIIYSMLVGESGTGKTPAYTHLCSNITAPLDMELFRRYKQDLKAWQENREEARNAKTTFKDPMPRRRIRMATSGTMEGIMAHSMTSPAGFGMYYDEGGKMLGTPNQYKRDTSSIDFWNETWNGMPFNDLRADEEKERFVASSNISVLIGMQTDRVGKYFTADSIDSGLPFRFLITIATRQPLRESVDHFATERRKPCPQWTELVRKLYWRGATELVLKLYWRGATEFNSESDATSVEFTDAARRAYNTLSSHLITQSNKMHLSRKKDGITALMTGYESKLYSYVGRFLIILAVIDDCVNPVINESHVQKAALLYNYYRSQGQRLFSIMQDDDLTQNERLLLEALPDEEFGSNEIAHACAALNVSSQFFTTSFRRKFRNGFIKRVSRGRYLKDT